MKYTKESQAKAVAAERERVLMCLLEELSRIVEPDPEEEDDLRPKAKRKAAV